MFKFSTVNRVFKVVRVVAIAMLLAHFAGFGPSQMLNQFKSRLGLQVSKGEAAVEKKTPAVAVVESSDEDLCLPMGERDRKALVRATGVDVIRFLEQSTRELHRAISAEDQLRVIASSFDHANWSKAWIGLAESVGDDAHLQANLSHASMVMARYNRLLENGRRQETSALKAFHWQEEVRQELNREPVRILVQSFRPYKCEKSDASYYGCELGETIYRVKSLISPRIACRFKEKRDQYAVVYWVRVKDRLPKILEVDAKGQRLVKVTFDEVEHRKVLSALAPNVSDILQSAGLDPLRAVVLWRQTNRASEGKVAVYPTREASDKYLPDSY